MVKSLFTRHKNNRGTRQLWRQSRFLACANKIGASNELLMGCGPLPDWLRDKPCAYALDTFDDNLCVWRCLAIYKRLARGEKNWVQERNRNAALNLAREYYGGKNLKKGTWDPQNLLILKSLQNTKMWISCCMNQRGTGERTQDLCGG